jgi:3'(2'), 5'-bisphosphate nucleotidase
MMLEQICQLARDAGDAIMKVYDGEQPLNARQKNDDSPVTAADIAAHNVIKKGLLALDPQTPLLSEEDPPSWAVRQNWTRFWLVDPLDGTKEFLKRNGEFTVNIALIENGLPVLGVVYVPVTGVLYAAADGKAWKEENGDRVEITAREAHPPLVVVSRSHSSDQELQDYLAQLGEVLSGCRRIGTALSALRAYLGLGHGRWPRRSQRRRCDRHRLAGPDADLYTA